MSENNESPAQASSFSTLSKFLSLRAAAPREPQAASLVPSGAIIMMESVGG